jgi:hypothetical protein
MKAFDFLIGLSIAAIVLTACGKQAEIKQEGPRSSNRIMGVYVGSDETLKPQLSSFFVLFQKALQDAYLPQLKMLNFPGGPYPDEAENMYEIAKSQIDDLFVFNISQRNQVIRVTGSIMSGGSNLRVINRINLELPIEGSPDRPSDEKLSFQDRFVQQIRQSILAAYPNPNVYPAFNAFQFANALYAKAQSDEASAGGSITCENAPRTLSHYAKAKEIYELGQKRSLVRAYGSQSEQHEINTRLQDAEDKTRVANLCAIDSQKSFGLTWKFQAIDESNRPSILKAAQTAGLEEILKKYTDKPVEIQLSGDPSGEVNLNLVLRFDSKRYLQWINKRVPDRYRNFGVLSLDPYYALMQKLVYFKNSLPTDSSPALKQGFSLMKMNIILNTILNGEVMFGVGGTYNAQEGKIRLAYPASLYVQAPGYEKKLVGNKDQELFQEKTWLALGSCRSLDGTVTEDGLVYKFFGIKCPGDRATNE